jgi:hypothetical protein
MSLRKPTCRINGIHVVEAEVLVHRYQSANDFTATLSMTAIEQKGGGVSQWLNAKQSVSIIGGDSLGKTKTLIQGTVDAAEANWKQRTIRIQGRDEGTAKLIDSTVDPQKDQFQNKSSEDVVRELAGRNGLSVETDGGGGGQDKAGRTHVKDEYNLITGQESAWNVIRQLAEREGKVAYVDDQNKLPFCQAGKFRRRIDHFNPLPQTGPRAPGGELHRTWGYDPLPRQRDQSRRHILPFPRQENLLRKRRRR